ncbi:MAG: rhomboid family intramembrane serine protease [Bdellovibrionales bacterium]|nr:rhomboid family intramembrane serine protease [Bdellovibrionales bacterium]
MSLEINRFPSSRFFKKRRLSPVFIFIGINSLVFLAWGYSNYNLSTYYFMRSNFLVSWTSLTDGRIWTLVTSAFSHNMLWHFLINMFVLANFGPIVERILGRYHFIKFYFGAALISSLCHSIVSAFIIGDPSLPALGASGALSGLILIFSMVFPRERILIMGILPIPAFWGALLFVGLDIWGLVAQAEGGGLPIGHGAHLGGAFTGILYYLFVLRRRIGHVGFQ